MQFQLKLMRTVNFICVYLVNWRTVLWLTSNVKYFMDDIRNYQWWSNKTIFPTITVLIDTLFFLVFAYRLLPFRMLPSNLFQCNMTIPRFTKLRFTVWWNWKCYTDYDVMFKWYQDWLFADDESAQNLYKVPQFDWKLSFNCVNSFICLFLSSSY